ncbi:MAG: nucleoside triphosphate hydrolase [Pseudomonadota bacterium]|nr:nucleoside triphosphate hydrolase [Pseudomonadota bacterium]
MADYDIERIASSLLKARGDQCRFLVAIAGAPASGKSTFSEALSNYLNESCNIRSVVVPMDGFHLDNDCLDDLKLRHRKGAPETYDVDSFSRLLRRLKISDQSIHYPTFDRALDKVIAESSAVYPEDQVVLVEGNYLLFDEQPWSELKLLFDYSIFLNTPFNVLQSRLIQRWLDHDHTPEEAQARALSNDIPNARRIYERLLKADQVMGMD